MSVTLHRAVEARGSALIHTLRCFMWSVWTLTTLKYAVMFPQEVLTSGLCAAFTPLFSIMFFFFAAFVSYCGSLVFTVIEYNALEVK